MSILATEGDDGRGVSITVIVPTNSENQSQTQGSQSTLPPVYPVSVWETRDSTRREIIRVYELMPNEHPNQIPSEPFERDGFRFELAEITRREMPVHSMREHVEIIDISTQTNDLETVIRFLSPTLEFVSDDGYFGILTLDVSSIKIESQGTTSSNFTQTITRELPHLSSADTSLVPRTVTENGRTYNLVNVDWRTQSTNAIDYTQVPSSFTAVATYSRTATSTSTIGFTTTAEYRGQISRIATGRTEFTAQFIGIPIVLGVVIANQPYTNSGVSGEESVTTQEIVAADNPELSSSQEQKTIENVTVEQVHIGGIVIEMEREILLQENESMHESVYDNTNGESNLGDESQSSRFSISILVIVMLFIGGLVLAYLVGKKGKGIFSGMKTISCLLLAVGMIYGFSNNAYATPMPKYIFDLTELRFPTDLLDTEFSFDMKKY